MAHPNATERIQFGEWQASDLPQAQLLWGDPDVTRLISKDGFSPQMIEDRLALEVRSLAQDQVQYWPLFAADGDLIGCCGLHARPHGEYELGYHLRPAYWHQGLATEAAKAVVQYATTQLHAPALIAGHNPANLASKHVILKLGFQYTHDELYPPTGKYSPMYRLVLQGDTEAKGA